jgi:hypothetical protein
VAIYPAIAATSEAVRSLLKGAAADTEFAGTDFELFQASNLQKFPEKATVSLYLYRVVVNNAQRNMAPRPAPNGRRRRHPLPLDLHYLLIAWAKDAASQQRALAWCARVLEDTSILPSSLLNAVGPENDVFFPDETVELTYDPLSLQDLYNVWQVAPTNQQPSLAYVARMVRIESPTTLAEYEPVQTRDFGLGKVILP